MGLSTDGQICFGFFFEDGYEFPWEGDIEDWWRKVNGFVPSTPIYNDEDEYINGVRPDESVFEKYWAERKLFDNLHPLPVELVNYCSGDYAAFILAVPSTIKTAHRGNPTRFDPSALTVTDEQVIALEEFCHKYGLKPEGEYGWWLTSYMG